MFVATICGMNKNYDFHSSCTLQDDAFTESYISTIGVDFVSFLFSF
jgi:hypothetical protein